jgi:hypothetical protein
MTDIEISLTFYFFLFLALGFLAGAFTQWRYGKHNYKDWKLKGKSPNSKLN